jgi:anaerobic magnesium-protoporphyrin IX monomethyl ester cyclase
MRTDVLFVTQESAYPQMGVLYLMDALRQQGLSAELVSSGIGSREFAAVMDARKPKVVGMSVMTSPEIVDFERISTLIQKNYTGVPVVWGGAHPTLVTDVCAAADYIDHVFVGQAEDLFPQMVRDLIAGARVPRIVRGHSPRNLDRYQPAWDKVDVSRFLFSERHSVRSPDVRARTPKPALVQAGELLSQRDIAVADYSPYPSLTDEQMRKWDVGNYRSYERLFYYLLTSRGCPYKCTFCSEPLQVMNGDEDGRFLWVAHGVEWVKRQVEQIRSELDARQPGLDIDGIGIWDDMFWVHHRTDPRAFEILEYLRSEKLGYLIEARPDQLMRDDGDLMRMLADTGCLQVFIGAESASQETLNYIRKGTKVADYFRLMRLADKYRVALRMSFNVGFPEETDMSINANLDLCEAINAGEYGQWVNVSGPKIFTPYPGTMEFQRAAKAGFRSSLSNVEWGGVNRTTEEYLRHFPWFKRNYSAVTLKRLERHFGAGYLKLRSH